MSYLIGVAGPSCSGKSEISRRLARLLRAPILALDHYYRDLGHLTYAERSQTNFDAPDALDHDLMIEHLNLLKQGLAIDQPTYDFSRHTRSTATERIPPADFIVVEGLFVLCWEDVRLALDDRIYITADHDICLDRRVFRDVRERGRTEQSVRTQYESTVRPMCDSHVLPTECFADLVLSGIAPLKQSVLKILQHLTERLRHTVWYERVEIAMSDSSYP